MQYRPLGATGMQVSPFALGTMMFGAHGNPDPDDCARILHRALDAGINLVDTADAYGESEEILGKALVGRRDEVVLASKFGLPMGEDPNARGGSRRWIMRSVEASLRRLGTDHLDLYQLHRPDPDTDISETLGALTDLAQAGTIRAFGTSAMPASDMVQARWTAERHGLVPFRTEQPMYSILDRGIEREVLPVAQRQGMGVVVFSPLAMGLLTGRVRRGAPTDIRRTQMFSHVQDPDRLDAVEALIALAEEAGLPLTHMAMAFAITHPGVTSALIGPRTHGHLDDLLAAVEVTLDDDLLDRIDAIVAPGTVVGTVDRVTYHPPAIADAGRRRRAAPDRAAA